jgi:hypothetical protein
MELCGCRSRGSLGLCRNARDTFEASGVEARGYSGDGASVAPRADLAPAEPPCGDPRVAPGCAAASPEPRRARDGQLDDGGIGRHRG